MKEKDYRTSAEQRAKMVAYYWQNRERLLEYQRKYKEEQKARDEKVFATPQEFYEDWQEYILKKLKTKLPDWIRVGLEHQWLQNKQRLYELNNKSI